MLILYRCLIFSQCSNIVVTSPGSKLLPGPNHGTRCIAAKCSSSSAQQRAGQAGGWSDSGPSSLPVRASALWWGSEGHMHHQTPDGRWRGGQTRRPTAGDQSCWEKRLKLQLLLMSLTQRMFVFQSNHTLSPSYLYVGRAGETDEDRESVCDVAAEVSPVQHAHLCKSKTVHLFCTTS